MSTMLGVIRLSRMWPHLGAPYSTIPTSALTIAACGPVLYVYYFLTNVLLDNFLLLDDFLTQADLLLDHRAFLYHDLFLDNGYPDLAIFFDDPALRGFLATLRCSPVLLDRHPPHANLLALFGHREPFAVCPYPLADVDAARLTLAGTGYQLLLTPLHPYLVFVGSALSITPDGAFASGTSDGFSSWGSRASALCVARCSTCALAGLQIYPLVSGGLGVVCTVVTFPV